MPSSTTRLPPLSSATTRDELGSLMAAHIQDMVQRTFLPPEHIDVTVTPDFDLPTLRHTFAVTLRNRNERHRMLQMTPDYVVDDDRLTLTLPSLLAADYDRLGWPLTATEASTRLHRTDMEERRLRHAMGPGAFLTFNSPGVFIVDGNPVGPRINLRLDPANEADHAVMDVILRQWDRRGRGAVEVTDELLECLFVRGDLNRADFPADTLAALRRGSDAVRTAPTTGRAAPPATPARAPEPRVARRKAAVPTLTNDPLSMRRQQGRKLDIEEPASTQTLSGYRPSARLLGLVEAEGGTMHATLHGRWGWADPHAEAIGIVGCYVYTWYEEADDWLQALTLGALSDVLTEIEKIARLDERPAWRTAATEIHTAVLPIWRRKMETHVSEVAATPTVPKPAVSKRRLRLDDEPEPAPVRKVKTTKPQPPTTRRLSTPSLAEIERDPALRLRAEVFAREAEEYLLYGPNGPPQPSNLIHPTELAARSAGILRGMREEPPLSLLDRLRNLPASESLRINRIQFGNRTPAAGVDVSAHGDRTVRTRLNFGENGTFTLTPTPDEDQDDDDDNDLDDDYGFGGDE